MYVTHAVKNGKGAKSTNASAGLTVDGVTFYAYSSNVWKVSVAGTYYALTSDSSVASVVAEVHATANQQVTLPHPYINSLAFIPD